MPHGASVSFTSTIQTDTSLASPNCCRQAHEAGDTGFIVDLESRGMIEKVCAACHEPIKDGEQWFRVRQEYVHLSCAEKYLRKVSERRKESDRRDAEK
jgi:hypothetical protein